MPKRLAYIGTYTDPAAQAGRPVTADAPLMGMTGPTGSEGIYVLRQDTATGALTPLGAVAGVPNPSFLALDPGGRFLFAVNEACDWEGMGTGAVSSFALDPETGLPRPINQVTSGGKNPCHLTVAPGGRFLLVANWEDGRVAVLPIAEDGRLGEPVDVRHDEPLPGAGRVPHAHFITPDPAGRHVLWSDTGTDRVSVATLDPATGRLVPHDPPWGETHPGGGPRHLAFSPDGRTLYANGEADMTLSVFDYDAGRGTLASRQHLSTLPPSIANDGRFTTAQLQAHPNGRAVYVANRGHDTIAVFGIDPATGAATLRANEPTRGRTPRNFSLDPDGRFLYVANQNSDTIVAFAVEPDTGLLTATGDAAHIPAPTCILFAGSGA